MKLDAIQVRNAKPGRHADGRGLYLLVKAKRNPRTGAIESCHGSQFAPDGSVLNGPAVRPLAAVDDDADAAAE